MVQEQHEHKNIKFFGFPKIDKKNIKEVITKLFKDKLHVHDLEFVSTIKVRKRRDQTRLIISNFHL